MSRPVDPPKFVAASVDDLKENGIIFINGRQATITEVDFPLVYYRFDGDNAIKHRSYTASSEFFQVIQRSNSATVQTRKGRPRPAKRPVVQNNGNSDEEEDDSQPRAEAGASSSPAGAGAVASSSSTESSEVKSTSSLFLAAFQKRPGRHVLSGLGIQKVESDAAAPQSLCVEDCEGTTVSLPKKVAGITVARCTNVRLDFTGSISTVDVIKCDNCKITCTQGCALYMIDGCNSVKITFPGSLDNVKFVTSGSTEIQLVAQMTDGPDVVKTMSSLPRSDNAVGLAAQDTLEWSGSQGRFSDQESLQREGIGYIKNM